MKNSTAVDFDIADSFVVDFDVLKSKKKDSTKTPEKQSKEIPREVQVELEIYKI